MRTKNRKPISDDNADAAGFDIGGKIVSSPADEVAQPAAPQVVAVNVESKVAVEAKPQVKPQDDALPADFAKALERLKAATKAFEDTPPRERALMHARWMDLQRIRAHVYSLQQTPPAPVMSSLTPSSLPGYRRHVSAAEIARLKATL